MEAKSDVVNDLDGAHEPSFVGVAICIGTDLEGDPVTLLDRLCINRPGVEKITGDMEICQQDARLSAREAAVCSNNRDLQEARVGFISVVSFIELIAIGVLAILLHRRK